MTAVQRQVPLIIERAAAGDFAPFLSLLRGGDSPFALGLYLSVACSQGVSRIEPDELHGRTAGTFLGDYRVAQELAACAEWPTNPVDESFFEVPTADVPVLIISGEMDHVTPPRFASELCAALPRCRMVSIPHFSHGPFDLDEWVGGECFDLLAIDFFAQPDTSRTECVSGMVPPAFALRFPAGDHVPDAPSSGSP